MTSAALSFRNVDHTWEVPKMNIANLSSFGARDAGAYLLLIRPLSVSPGRHNSGFGLKRASHGQRHKQR